MFATILKKLTAKLALAVMLTGLIAPMHAVADGNTGQLTILVSPSQGTYQVLDDVDGSVALSQRSGNANVAGFPAGDYRITYSDIAGYTKPADQAFSMVPGGQITLTGNYQPITHSGNLSVVVSPATGKYEVRDNVTGTVVASERSGSQSFVIPFGDYIVDFKDITGGYATPADQALTLDGSHLNVTVTGVYQTVSTSGTVSVTVSPATGKYEIKDNVLGSVVVAETVGNKNFVLPFGDYIVDFKDITGGYATPADQAFSLNAQSNAINIHGDYQSTTTVTGTLTVTVSPVAGTYEVRDDVTGAVMVAQTSGNRSFVLPYGDYIVDFKDIANYIAPTDQTFGLNAQSKTVSIVGNYTTQAGTGTVVVNVVNQANQAITDAQWELRSCTGATLDSCFIVVANSTRSMTLNTLSEGTYAVFASLTPNYSGRVVLGSNPLALPATNTIYFNIQYTEKVAVDHFAGIQVTTQPVAGGIKVNGVTIGTPASAGAYIPTPAMQVDVTQANTISFVPVNGYNTPADILIPAGTLAAGSTTQYTGTYQTNNFATLALTTTPVAGEIFIDGVSVGTPANAGAVININVANPGDRVISFGTVANYNTPADQTVTVTAAQIQANATIPVSGVYTPQGGSNIGTVRVNQVGGIGTVALAGPSAASVTVANYSNASAATGDYTLGTITAPAGSTLVNVTNELGTVLVAPYTQTLARNGTVTFNVNYQAINPNTGTIQINVKDDAGAAVTNGSWTLMDGTTPVNGTATLTISPVAIGSYTVTATVPAALASIYSGVTVTPSTAQSLAANQTITFDVVYQRITAILTVTKTAVETPVANNNKRIDYTVTVTNVGNTLLNVRLSDTITGTGLINANGGILAYVPGTFTCTGVTCTLPTLDGIANQAVTVALQNTGSAAVLKYQMLSSNAGQTSVATFSNTVTATYTNPANQQTETVTALKSVTVNPPTPVVNPPSSGGGSSGGSGVGGGHTLIKGEMNLSIQKLVSTDGKTYRSAQGNKQAIAIPENKATRLYTKIVITNPSDLSARNIRLAPFFDSGKSDMTADKIQDLKGATLDVLKQILVEKIKAKETIEFTYSVLVYENGQNVNPAIEGLEVTDIDSFLPDTQDGLAYKNKGQKIGTYLYAGRVPAGNTVAEEAKPSVPKNAFGNGSDMLAINVSMDKAQAAIGETVNFSITLENVSDRDLTNLFITHATPAELSILNAGGGRDDGHEILWQAPILRPGEKLTKHFVAKVMAGAPGSRLHSLTRVLTSEAENIAPVDSYLTVLGGAPRSVAKAYQLVQTGPAGILSLLMLSILSALAFQALGKRRALKLKELALRPL